MQEAAAIQTAFRDKDTEAVSTAMLDRWPPPAPSRTCATSFTLAPEHVRENAFALVEAGAVLLAR